MFKKHTIALTAAAAIITSGAAFAHENQVEIIRTGGELCISSNGMPNHDTGTFPNQGNPHALEEQNLTYCVDGDPVKTSTATYQVATSGISITGIPFRPNTADYYDASSPRGFSRDSSSGWNLEGMGASDMLGMDENNAHVDVRGLYHYHGSPTGLLETSDDTLIGFAADGFEIHYVGNAAESGWTLKEGTRPTAPGGAYDGTYVEDWEYTASGNLDECNGALLNGEEYVYFATDSYPYYPRCFWGEVSSDFLRP